MAETAVFIEKDLDVFAMIKSKNQHAEHIRSYVTIGVYLRTA